MDEKDFFWLVGLLEGEGSFLRAPPSKPYSPVVSVQMTDEDVVGRVARLWGVNYCRITPRHVNHKVSFAARTTGKRAVDLMVQLRPYMGERRKGQIDRAIATYRVVPNWNSQPRYDKDEILALWKTGLSYRKIGRLVGCHHNAVMKVVNFFKSTVP